MQLLLHTVVTTLCLLSLHFLTPFSSSSRKTGSHATRSRGQSSSPFLLIPWFAQLTSFLSTWELLFLKEQSIVGLSCFASSSPFKQQRLQMYYTMLEKKKHINIKIYMPLQHQLLIHTHCPLPCRLRCSKSNEQSFLGFLEKRDAKKWKEKRLEIAKVVRFQNGSVTNHSSSLVHLPLPSPKKLWSI